MVLKKDLTIKQKLQFAVVDTESRDCIMWATSIAAGMYRAIHILKCGRGKLTYGVWEIVGSCPVGS